MSAEVLFDLASTSSLPFPIEVKEEIKDGIYNIITPVGEISVCNDTNAGHYFSEASKDDCLEDVLEFITSALTTELYESPTKERNENKYGHLIGNQCICCYKPMKEGEVKWVQMNENWKALHISVTDENCKELTGYNSQGCFPIGNACAKKMPKDFVFIWDNKFAQ